MRRTFSGLALLACGAALAGSGAVLASNDAALSSHGAALASNDAALAGSGADAAATGLVQLCRPYQYLPVSNRAGERLIVRNDNYGGFAECLVNAGSSDNFTVSRSEADSRVQPAAYPYIFRGCSWGLCTPGSGLPARLATVGRAWTSWATRQRAGGSWDATYDIWFGRSPITTGQATGGELMIWLGSRHRPPPDRHARIVWAGHARWYLHSWRTHHAGYSWRLIEFRRVRPVWRAALSLGPFIRIIEKRGWVRPSSWLLSIEAGFEIWRGGTGLATTAFSARA